MASDPRWMTAERRLDLSIGDHPDRDELLYQHSLAADERIAELEAERDELRTAVKEVCEEAAHDLDTMSEATAERVMACFGPSGKMAEGE